MNLDVFLKRDLQHFIVIAQECEVSGVTDIRFVRERIQKYINAKFQPPRIRARKPTGQKPAYKACPSCKEGLLMPVINREGLNIVGCKRCRHSEVIS